MSGSLKRNRDKRHIISNPHETYYEEWGWGEQNGMGSFLIIDERNDGV